MIIQYVLILGLIAVLFKFLLTSTGSTAGAWKRIIGLLFIIAAVLAIIFPDELNNIAHSVGVGRGADLLTYLVALAVIGLYLSIHIKREQDQKNITTLTRRLAILESKHDKYHNDRQITDKN